MPKLHKRQTRMSCVIASLTLVGVQVHLNGRITAAVEDLASENLSDGHLGELFE